MKTSIIKFLVLCFMISSCQGEYSSDGMAEDHKESSSDEAPGSSYDKKEMSSEEYEPSTRSKNNDGGDDYIEKQLMTSSAARLYNDSLHKFVIRSNVKFKVDDVYKSTLKVENITGKMDGLVINSNLSSNVQSNYTQKVSADSILEITEFYRNINMTIKVPSKNLEQFLLSIASEISFLNYRNIHAEEVTIQLRAHEWMKEQFKNYQEEIRKISVPDNNKNTLSELEKIKALYRQKEIEKDRLVEHWKLQDDIEYSLVTIKMYGRDQKQIKKFAISDDIEKYEPGFWSKTYSAFAKGWNGIQKVFIGLITIWPVFLIGIIVWLIIKKFIRKKITNK